MLKASAPATSLVSVLMLLLQTVKPLQEYLVQDMPAAISDRFMLVIHLFVAVTKIM